MKNSKKLVILAGGGLVENEKGEFLFMFRRGKWDLPKGKMDPGETLEACALREVEEETGVGKLVIINRLLITHHEYLEKGIPVIKETHWYFMNAPSGQILNPQIEEDITELKWLTPSEFNLILTNTYPTILDVLRAGGVLGPDA